MSSCLIISCWMRWKKTARRDNKIGTTRKGIGPCYMDKAARNGIRIADLMVADAFEQKARAIIAEKNQVITQMYGGEPLDADSDH